MVSMFFETFIFSSDCFERCTTFLFARRFKDGEEIKSDDERIKTSAAPDGTLKLNIEKVDATDSGAYKAVAVNDLGKSIANTAVVVESKRMYQYLRLPLLRNY